MINFNDYQRRIRIIADEKTAQQLVLDLAEIVGTMAAAVNAEAPAGNTMMAAEQLLATLSELCSLAHFSLDDLALNSLYRKIKSTRKGQLPCRYR